MFGRPPIRKGTRGTIVAVGDMVLVQVTSHYIPITLHKKEFAIIVKGEDA